MKEKNISLLLGEIRIYEEETKNSIFLSKIFIVKNEDKYFDLLSGESYKTYSSYADYKKDKKLKTGEIFCVLQETLNYKKDPIEYMIDSSDYFYQRLPYLQSRFRMFSKKENSSYLLPILKEYREKIQSDNEKLLILKEIIVRKREKEISKKIIKKNKNETKR